MVQRPAASPSSIRSILWWAILLGVIVSLGWNVWSVLTIGIAGKTVGSSSLSSRLMMMTTTDEEQRWAARVEQLEHDLEASRRQVEIFEQRQQRQDETLRMQLLQTALSSSSFLPSKEAQSTTTATSDVTGGEDALSANRTMLASVVLRALHSMSAAEEDAVWDALHGREFHYRLSCPDHTLNDTVQLLQETNTSVIVGYHIGMMNNWRQIVRDQLYTLHACGVGRRLADHLYISYSNNETLTDELDELHAMLHRYNFASRTTILYSPGQPVEGAAINALHQECQRRHGIRSHPTDPLDESDDRGDTVAFYFHTKGSSRYNADWPDHMTARFQYPTALYWRKYMEYFTIERPQICLHQIVQYQKYTCAVYWLPQRQFYGGNFWVASGRYLATLPPLPVHNESESQNRWNAEGWITETYRLNNTFAPMADRFVTLHDPPAGLYQYLIQPHVYSDYTRRWEKWLLETK
jgi:hypothetical protein